MSSFGSQIRKRLRELEVLGNQFSEVVEGCMESAAIAAVAAAVQHTPPNTGNIRGTNMRSGDMAQHWQTDSKTTPIRQGDKLECLLANNMQYASYVNDGHRVDKHFVPGLTVNGGMIEMASPNDKTGMMVGTKTEYVKGMYMKEKGIGKFRSTLRENLENEVRKIR